MQFAARVYSISIQYVHSALRWQLTRKKQCMYTIFFPRDVRNYRNYGKFTCVCYFFSATLRKLKCETNSMFWHFDMFRHLVRLSKSMCETICETGEKCNIQRSCTCDTQIHYYFLYARSLVVVYYKI